MKWEESTLPQILQCIDAVKQRGQGAFLTNYFQAQMVGPRILCGATERSVLFANEEHDFFRVYFFSTDVDDLERSLAALALPRPAVCSYLTKRADLRILESLERAGFVPHAVFRRMTNSSLPTQTSGSAPNFATPVELEQIHDALFETFDPYTSHLPTRERLLEYINARQILVNRHDDKVTGALVFQLQGRQTNYNFLYNRSGNPMDLLSLQSAFYRLLGEKGIRAGFLWVDRRNTGVSRMHERMGWRFEGLEDHFHLKALNH